MKKIVLFSLWIELSTLYGNSDIYSNITILISVSNVVHSFIRDCTYL